MKITGADELEHRNELNKIGPPRDSGVAVPSGLSGARFMVRTAPLIATLPHRKVRMAAISATST